MKNTITVLTCAIALVSMSCNTPSNSYDQYDVGSTQVVKEATVVHVKATTINTKSTGAGTGVGALAGGLLGSGFGSGYGQLAAAAGGVVAGALAGTAIDKKVSGESGVVITLQVQGEKNYRSVVQRGKANQFYQGQRGILRDGGTTGSRFEPYN